MIRRLSLPLNLWLALAVVGAALAFGAGLRAWRVLAALAVAGTFFFSIPSMARHDYTLDYYVGREMAWRREFIAAHPERDYLFIDNNSIMWITHLVSATPVVQAVNRKEIILFNLRNRIFSEIYVFQRLRVDPATGGLSFEADEDLGPAYHLEPVIEQRFTPLTVSRISRVVSVDDAAAPAATRPAPASKLSPEEQEKVRQEYMKEFIKQLP